MARLGLTASAVHDAAVDLADADGLDAVTISAVARRLGIRPASMYAHVRNIGALLDDLHRRGLAELGRLIADAVAGRSGWDALEGFATAHRRFAEGHPGLWQAVQRPASAEIAASPEAGQVAGLALAVLRGYGLTDDAAIHATRFVGSTVNGFVTLTEAGSFGHRPVDLDTSWTQCLDAIDRALRSWPRETTEA
ncbi:TetR/AcrR family transcriptional regulator [Aeromicrobium camelliae]|uniref:TetR/AcrR family transcriptional regulator n=1 Tax=Aeromicrobium camelliae TaxID=1538144 RepID=UPI00140DC463|nr:TetR/AcrR family transcriptional regulator [Aeromicrobium camelliae]